MIVGRLKCAWAPRTGMPSVRRLTHQGPTPLHRVRSFAARVEHCSHRSMLRCARAEMRSGLSRPAEGPGQSGDGSRVLLRSDRRRRRGSTQQPQAAMRDAVARPVDLGSELRACNRKSRRLSRSARGAYALAPGVGGKPLAREPGGKGRDLGERRELQLGPAPAGVLFPQVRSDEFGALEPWCRLLYAFRGEGRICARCFHSSRRSFW
jgi:hypothetical protein